MTKLNRYSATDGTGSTEYCDAFSPREAANEYVATGEWGDITETVWFEILVTPVDDDDEETGEGEWIDVTLDPPLPPCAEGYEHEWKSPYSVLGGLRENPGVQGHGGGVIITEVCCHCGIYEITDNWAQNPDNGEQGLTSTSYRDADATSLAWVERRKAAVALGSIGGRSTSPAKRAAARVNAKKKAIGNVVIDT